MFMVSILLCSTMPLSADAAMIQRAGNSGTSTVREIEASITTGDAVLLDEGATEYSRAFDAMTRRYGAVKSMSYKVHDDHGILVKEGNVSFDGTSWTTEDLGLVIGMNDLTVITQHVNGRQSSRTYRIANANVDLMERINVDEGDDDNDGLNNYLEAYYGTDPALADSDGDGLDDYLELAVISTDPSKADSMDDGIRDGDRDSDGDGLTNIEEVGFGSDPAVIDSDGDGHSDYEEKMSGTDPMFAVYDEAWLMADEPAVSVAAYPSLNYNYSTVDSDGDGLYDHSDPNPYSWNVCDRDLIMFAALSYENGSNRINSMYRNYDLFGSSEGAYYYFCNGASLDEQDRGISERWRIVDFVNTKESIDTYFSATTFVNGDNVVIAIRGTNEKVGEWVWDILGTGLINFHVEETAARNYVRKICARYPYANIYVTGHSLGGYLAQIVTSEMINVCGKAPTKVAYFNGIGLKYNKLLFWSKNTELNTLKDYARGHELISYETYGDVVCMFGTHSGVRISDYVQPEPRNNHRGAHNATGAFALGVSLTTLNLVTGQNVRSIYNYYGCTALMEYLYITHETDSFFYRLSQGYRTYRVTSYY